MPHAAIQLAPPVITLVTDSKAPAGLLRTHATTDLDLDGSQSIDDLRFTESLAQDNPLIPTRYESFTPKTGSSLGGRTGSLTPEH